MKTRYFYIIIFIIFTNAQAKIDGLDDKFISLKDFIILKFDVFLERNLINVARGGGITGVSYQAIKYDLNIDKKDNISISIDATMNKKRYSSKKYYPKLRDCNQVRNKIFVNKYGYNPFSQNFNNLVNEDILTNKINDQVLNISTLNDSFKDKILDKTKIKINIIHPKKDKSISCSGRLIDSELN